MPNLMGAPFVTAIRWTGLWNADDYDDVTGIAIGQKSFGPSGGRNTAPSTGAIPARVFDAVTGHHYFECRNSLETWLTTNRLMDEFLGGTGRGHMFYAVLKVISQEDVGDGSTAPCIMSGPAGADGVKFGKSFGNTNPSLQAAGVGTLFPFVWNASVSDEHGFALGQLGLYEAYMDPRDGAEALSYGERSSWNGTLASLFFTNGRGPEVIPVPGSPIAELFHGPGTLLSERWLDADVYEIKISDVCYPASTRAQIRAELMAKYGITP